MLVSKILIPCFYNSCDLNDADKIYTIYVHDN